MDWIVRRLRAFDMLSALAFCTFGMLFVMRPMTWSHTVLVLLGVVYAMRGQDVRQAAMGTLLSIQWRWVVIPVVAWFVLSVCLGLWHLGLAKKAFPENAFRMVLILIVLVWPVQQKARFWWLAGLLFAAVASVFDIALSHWTVDPYLPRVRGTTNHPIHFGNFCALLATLLITASVLWRDLGRRLRWFCFLAAALALLGITVSMTRSSLLVLLCVLPLAWIPCVDRWHRWAVRTGGVLALVFVIAVTLTPSIQEKLRLKEVVTDIEQVQGSNYQTPIGARFSMWEAAWEMFEENPWVGIGPSNFQEAYRKKVERGDVPMGDAIHNQPHNDILHAATSGGVFKLMSYLLLLGGPFVFFYKYYEQVRRDLDRRIFPIMGMQVVAAFFIAGLTNSNFDLQIYSTMYVVLVCVLAKLTVFEITEAVPSKLSTPSTPAH